MRWLIWRELALVSRRSAFWVAISVYVLALAAFVVIWSDGVPGLSGPTVFDQFLSVQAVVLLAVMPWVAARCGITEDKEDLTLLAIAAGCRPSRLITAKSVALTIALVVLAACGLPMTFVALQISALPAGRLGQELVPLVALCGFVAAVTMVCMLTSVSRLAGWLLASIAIVAVVQAVPSGIISTAALSAIALIATGALARRANVSWRYLSDTSRCG